MIDVRLAVPAVAAWLGAIAIQVGADQLSNALIEPGMRRAVIGVISLVTCAACMPWVLGWLPRRRPSAGSLAASVALGLAVGVGSAGLMGVSLAAEPVAGWSQARATATVQGVITSDPVARTRTGAAIWQDSTMLEARISTSSVAARGDGVEIGLPMMLRAAGTGEETDMLPPVGSRVEVTGRLGPARTPGIAATLAVRDRSAIVVLQGPGLLDTAANAMRSGLRSSVAGVWPDAGALVAGLAVG
ncbi:MAG: hypothetical protein ACKOE2_11020, partial [Actinomycetales bacterium]